MRSKRGLVALLGVVVVLAAWYALLWSPTSKSLAGAKAQRAAAVTAEQTVALQKAALLVKVRELPARRAEAAALNQQLPPTAAIPDFIDQISAIAQRTGVSLGGLTQGVSSTAGSTSTGSSTNGTSSATSPSSSSSGSASSGSTLGTLSVQVSVTGDYQQAMSFLTALQHIPRYVAISTTGITGTSAKLTVALSASAYFDSSALPSAPKVAAT